MFSKDSAVVKMIRVWRPYFDYICVSIIVLGIIDHLFFNHVTLPLERMSLAAGSAAAYVWAYFTFMHLRKKISRRPKNERLTFNLLINYIVRSIYVVSRRYRFVLTEKGLVKYTVAEMDGIKIFITNRMNSFKLQARSFIRKK